MQEVENLIKTTIDEIEKVLSTKIVVGEPMVIKDNTLIPLISIGFGFGVGAGAGKSEMKQKGEGTGGCGGAGVGIKPTAIIIVDKEGNVRIETIKGSMAAVLERWGDNIPKMMEKCMETCMQKWGKKEEEKEG